MMIFLSNSSIVSLLFAAFSKKKKNRLTLCWKGIKATQELDSFKWDGNKKDLHPGKGDLCDITKGLISSGGKQKLS